MATSESEPVARLPFRFDTAGVVTTIVRVVAALLCVLVAGVVYLFFVRRHTAAAAGLLALSAGVVWLGRAVLANLEGTRGVITRDAVHVHPGGVYGMRMAGPAGTFPLQTFKQVRVDRVLPSEDTQSRGYERVLLVRKQALPDILVAREDLDVGRVLGRSLAEALGLPFDERLAPY
jgi:hypothetical protein